MAIDFEKPIEETLQYLSEKIISEAPDKFVNTIVSTRSNFIYSNNFDLEGHKKLFTSIINEHFENRTNTDDLGIRLGISLQTTTGEKIFNIIGVAKEYSDGKKRPKEEIALTLLHELAHITDNNFSDKHQREVFANSFSYLLFVREIGDNNLIKDKIFSNSNEIFQNHNGDIARYYSTDALLAADYVANNINLKTTSFAQLHKIATTITKEFSITPEKRLELFNKASSATINIEDNGVSCQKILLSLLDTDDKDTYRMCKYISLSQEFNDALIKIGLNKNKDLKKLLLIKDKTEKFILNPLEDKKNKRIKSPTLKAVRKLKYSCL